MTHEETLIAIDEALATLIPRAQKVYRDAANERLWITGPTTREIAEIANAVAQLQQTKLATEAEVRRTATRQDCPPPPPLDQLKYG